jgi:hypothetical protein
MQRFSEPVVSVVSDILERRIVMNQSNLIKQTFEETKETVDQWMEKFTLQPHITEYLKKLILQIGFAMNLLSTQPIPDEKCVKIIALWKCARRRDVIDYFKKLNANQKQSEYSTITGIPPFDIKTTVPITEDWFEAMLALPNLLDIKHAGRKIKHFGNNNLLAGIEFILLNKLTLDRPGAASSINEYMEFKDSKAYSFDSQTNLSDMLSDSKTALSDTCIFEMKLGRVKSSWFKMILASLTAAHLDVKGVKFLYNSFEIYFFLNFSSIQSAGFEVIWSRASQEDAKRICVSGHSPDTHFYSNPHSAYTSGECKSLMLSGNIPNKLPLFLFTVIRTAPAQSPRPMQVDRGGIQYHPG